MKVFIKALLGVAAWMGFFYFYAVKLSGTNAGVNMSVFFTSLTIFILYLLYITGMTDMWLSRIQNEKILKDGIPAKGVILSCSTTGVKTSTNSGFPHYGTEIKVKVDAPDGKKFITTAKMMLTESEIARIKSGMIVNIHYKPENRKRIAIDMFLDF